MSVEATAGKELWEQLAN